MYGRARWQEAEATIKDFNTLLTRQDNKFFASELFKVIQDAIPSHRQEWKVHQNTVYWVDIQLAQRKGLKFYQTRCNAVILYDTLPAYCISKAIVMKSEEIIYQKVYVSPQPPPFSTKIIGRAIWILMLQEAVKTSNESK